MHERTNSWKKCFKAYTLSRLLGLYILKGRYTAANFFENLKINKDLLFILWFLQINNSHINKTSFPMIISISIKKSNWDFFTKIYSYLMASCASWRIYCYVLIFLILRMRRGKEWWNELSEHSCWSLNFNHCMWSSRYNYLLQPDFYCHIACVQFAMWKNVPRLKIWVRIWMLCVQY